jgi:hypothetical protein
MHLNWYELVERESKPPLRRVIFEALGTHGIVNADLSALFHLQDGYPVW